MWLASLAVLVAACALALVMLAAQQWWHARGRLDGVRRREVRHRTLLAEAERAEWRTAVADTTSAVGSTVGSVAGALVRALPPTVRRARRWGAALSAPRQVVEPAAGHDHTLEHAIGDAVAEALEHPENLGDEPATPGEGPQPADSPESTSAWTETSDQYRSPGSPHGP